MSEHTRANHITYSHLHTAIEGFDSLGELALDPGGTPTVGVESGEVSDQSPEMLKQDLLTVIKQK